MDATLENVASWDSITAATLLTIVSEEFGIPIDYEVVDQLTSFVAIREYVTARRKAV
jgi:acyl carrier protein